MMICKRCGGPMQELFLSMACRQECDLKPVSKVLRGDAVLEGILAHQAYKCDSGWAYWDANGNWWRKSGISDKWICDGPCSVADIRDWWKHAGASGWEVCDAPTM